MKKTFTANGQEYTAKIVKDGKFYYVECLEVDTYTQGNTVEEALNNIKEVTELYLDGFLTKKFQKTKKISLLGSYVKATGSFRS